MALAETIRHEHQRLAQQVQQRIDDMSSQAAVRNAATVAQTQVQGLRQQLDDSQATVAKLQTKLDRLRCPATMRIFKETPAEQAPVDAIASQPAEVSKEPENTVKAEELEDALKLGESRLKEIENLCEEKVQLIRELDHLKLQLSSLPEARIVETGPYKQILARKEFYQTEAQTLKALVDKAESEIHELKSSRTQFEEALVTEEKTRRKALTVEIKRLEGDVTRLRANRDHIQRLYDASCAKEEAELLANQEIRTLANSRKARIEALSAEVHRLKMKIAADAGDKAATDYYSVNTELSHAEHLGRELEATKAQLAEATRELASHREAAENTKELQQ
ncbi:E3 ubiquitin-protein ligase bre1, partial [Dimargaris xerosporica]